MSGEFKDFREKLKPADALNDELKKVMGVFSQKDVVAVYAQQIISAAQAQRKAGYEVTGFVGELEAAAKSFLNTKDAVGVSGAPRVIPQTGLATSASQQFKMTVDRLTALVNSGEGGEDVMKALDAILKWQLTPPAPPPKPKTPFELAVDMFSAAVTIFDKGINLLFPTNAEGETIPALALAGGPGTVAGKTSTQTAEGVVTSLTIAPQFYFSEKIDRQTVRQEIVPEILDELESNTYGTGDRVIRFVVSRTQGVTSSRPAE